TSSFLLLFTTHSPPSWRFCPRAYQPVCPRGAPAEAPLFSSIGTVYCCFAVARVTTMVVVPPLSLGASPELRSFSVIFCVLDSVVSPALRSSSDRLPTEEASQTFCASIV